MAIISGNTEKHFLSLGTIYKNLSAKCLNVISQAHFIDKPSKKTD
jgi:hypothetical protein